MVNLARLCIIANQACLDTGRYVYHLKLLCGGHFSITNIVKANTANSNKLDIVTKHNLTVTKP